MNVLADLILVIHFGFVLFVTGGLALIWLGAALRWQWVRGFWFRTAHLAAISFVALEALAGYACPLTVWEDGLRGTRPERSFVARWLHQLLFYEFPDSVFTIAYVLFACGVAITYWMIPPHRRKRAPDRNAL